jgi:hypothetical protein
VTAFLAGFLADRVEFVVVLPDGTQRSATVLRHDGPSVASIWLHDCGATLGDDQLDHLRKGHTCANPECGRVLTAQVGAKTCSKVCRDRARCQEASAVHPVAAQAL